ncbi:MAG: phage protease [Pseudomonadota bacterium]|nr:phage protease [Pseudomonadota bacterium]
MPIPKPQKDESQKEFVDRCMGDDVMVSEYPEKDKRSAVCHKQWGTKEFAQIEPDTYEIKDWEIFGAGRWNGQVFSEKDIQEIVDNFNSTKEALKPYVKLGHSEKQKIIQQDGLPSAGWIVSLKRKGEKLIADVKNVPKKIYELIKNKAYGRVSAEIFYNINIDGKKYRRALRSVALLGADTPAVTSLDDFIDLYENIEYEKIEKYDNMEQDMSAEKEIATLNEKIKKLEDKNSEDIVKMKAMEQKNIELENYIQKQEVEMKTKEIDAYIKEKIKEGKMLPSQYDEVMALSMSSEVMKFTKDSKTTEGTGFDLIKSIIDKNEKMIEFGEKSEYQKIEKNEKRYTDMTEQEKDDYICQKVDEYIEKNPAVQYNDAYSIVAAEIVGGK